jgi:glutamate dehydrogenase
MREQWSRIEALDHKVPAPILYLMMIETVELLRRNSQWILTNGRGKIEIGATITRYEKGVASLLRRPADLLVEFELHAFEEKRQMYVEQGVPEDLAATVASLEAMSAACDIVEVAEQDELPVEVVGSCYFRLGSLIGLDWLRNAAEECPVEDHWDRLAVNAMIDDIFRQQRALTLAALRLAKGRKPQEAAAEWARAHKEAVERTHQLMADFRSSGPMTVSKLGYAIRFVRQLVPR